MKFFLKCTTFLILITALASCSSEAPCVPVKCLNNGISAPDCGCNCPENYYDAACLFALMNKKVESIAALKISFEKGNTSFKHISIDDDLDNVRNSPEFITLYNEWFEKYKTSNNFKDLELK